jgi:cellulose synthase/poly-beta-1,6-N-acetylglucosamine synthase-like glycosyltransferase
VDDGSMDDTAKTLQQLMHQYAQLKSLYISPAEKTGSGKKFALQKGVQKATHEIILLTDADCAPATQNWIQLMVASMPGKKIVLGISPYNYQTGFLNAFIEYETSVTALQYVSYANSGLPYMGVGRNLCFQKDIFLQKKWSDKEMQLPSGDDDLFIQSMADSHNTTTSTNPESYTYSQSPPTWKDWFVQKKRHLATGYQYSLNQQVLLGSFLISKLCIYLSVFFLFFFYAFQPLPIALLFFHFLVLTAINFILHKKHRLNYRWYASAIFDIAYVFSIIFTGIAGKITPQRSWK